MSLRRWLYRQLAVAGWDGPGCSPTNRVVMAIIVINLGAQAIETEVTVREAFGPQLATLEWACAIFFLFEYTARFWVAGEDARYGGISGRLRWMVTPYALIDLLAILPAFLSLGTFDSSVLRAARLIRVLRFARFGALGIAISTLGEVFRSRRYDLLVSVMLMLASLIVASTAMYLVEGHAQPETFGSIPRALWWSVVTMTTVGYGDTYPITPLGQTIGGLMAVISIAVVAVPTGILAAAFSDVLQKHRHPPERPPRP